ncbi:hypothetical protein CDL15_Pgr015480 [Punica granatum]|uniref:RING-type E3 ubiquitin transferase n=1 Tax=Punica granatum TaxID=22663 RepID=A0A218VZP6_PUNGR|nr:hypothetical protein CDL15_Pgr015480 [Punica granatum]
MDRASPILSLLCLMLFFHANAQQASQSAVSDRDGYKFTPTLSIFVVVVSFAFMISWFLLLHSSFLQGWCIDGHFVHNNDNNNPMGITVTESMLPFSGLDRAVIESLPKFQFSLLRGLKDGLECSVCLSRFEDVEVLRLLPKCKHAFHVKCIDRWLENRSNCPLCRAKIEISPEHSILVDMDDAKRPWNGTDGQENSNAGIFVEREEDRVSSRFLGVVGNSFQKMIL